MPRLSRIALSVLALLHPVGAHAILGGAPLDLSRAVAHVTVAISTADTRAFCSGVLIAQNAVLTSAQCVYKRDPRQLFVTFGADALRSTLYRGVTRTYVPTQYRPYATELPAFRNAWDIAIVLFAGSLPKPYRIADLVPGSPLAPGELVDLAGFGATDFGLAGAGELRGCRTSVSDPATSSSEFETVGTELCGAAGRDAGGPVYRVLGTSVYVHGIHAWGWPAESGNPAYSVHTRIGAYLPWIQAILLNP